MIKYNCLKKQNKVFFVVILLVTVSYLSFARTPSSIKKNTQNDLIIPVFASQNRPSINPQVVRSGSGRIHLFFLHRSNDHDLFSHKPYHTYELEDGSWSQPEKVIDVSFLPLSQRNLIKPGGSFFTIKPKENGLVLYYFIDKGVYMKEFDEQLKRWSEPVKLFGESQVLANLDQSETAYQQIRWSVSSFFQCNNDSLFVVWGFKSRNTSVFTHESENQYIITRVDTNGSFISQPIQGSGVTYGYGNFVNTNDSLFFYHHRYYLNKTVLLPNGTWSKWQDSSFIFSDGVPELFGVINILYKYTLLVADRYLICYATDENGITKWGIVDLAADKLTARLLDLPHKPDTSKQYGRIIFKLIMNDQTRPMFMTAFLTNRTIEFWEYDYGHDTWNQMSVLEYTITESSQSTPFSIDLVPDGANWRAFWAQQIKDRNLLEEIFTVTYNPVTKEWGSVIQITDTRLITDDVTDTPLSLSHYFYHYFLVS